MSSCFKDQIQNCFKSKSLLLLLLLSKLPDSCSWTSKPGWSNTW